MCRWEDVACSWRCTVCLSQEPITCAGKTSGCWCQTWWCHSVTSFSFRPFIFSFPNVIMMLFSKGWHWAIVEISPLAGFFEWLKLKLHVCCCGLLKAKAGCKWERHWCWAMHVLYHYRQLLTVKWKCVQTLVLSHSNLAILTHALVTSTLDYCNTF